LNNIIYAYKSNLISLTSHLVHLICKRVLAVRSLRFISISIKTEHCEELETVNGENGSGSIKNCNNNALVTVPLTVIVF